MYAVIETGGKQYSVNVGDVLKVEKIDKPEGEKLTFSAIFVNENGSIKVGKKAESVKVIAEIVSHGKADKILVSTYRPKKRTKRKYGHRQPYTEIKILEIK